MNKRYIVMTGALLIAVSVISYWIGCQVTYAGIEHAVRQQGNDTTTFYATITDIDDSYVSVRGMDINDINYRGNFEFELTEETICQWRGTEIFLEEFDVNDNISITFAGEIQESDPAIILEVTKVQLLDDEK